MKVYFKTFGCRTNQFDTQIMMRHLGEYQVSDDELQSDVIVVNSCTVTNGADSSVRHYINNIKSKNPNAKVILAGCGAHLKGKELLKESKVFGVLGHSEKANIASLLKQNKPFYEIGNLKHIDTTIIEDFIGKSRAFVKIQEGCDFACSYCIIPTVRGKARSYPENIILKQIETLASNGFGEFILTGTNVGSYGKEVGSSIAKLLKKMSLIRGVRRIRIGSLEPIQVDSELIELLDEPWMSRHLHIAIQHTNDNMLKVMNRRNRYKSDFDLLWSIAEKGYALGTDFIVGHPGESEEFWQDALLGVQRLPLTHIHAFTYSKRDNTPSATMKQQVRGDIAKARHAQLVELIRTKNFEFRKKHNTNLQILIEQSKDGCFEGLDQYFNRIKVTSQINLHGNWITIPQAEVTNERTYAIF
ncbi:MAG TPA: tRNA (N(6)-L-threonylcarbamoyladenosine(37)-C(2))-methylthiotransferase MtaB [Epsilonproteobacteria bacterium]|nr:tRNA (N(6)-L-threonylcarbamoyladenosine(37)-C(2))-methylthiotransferase MtaB [Campylobacterota bacterium]